MKSSSDSMLVDAGVTRSVAFDFFSSSNRSERPLEIAARDSVSGSRSVDLSFFRVDLSEEQGAVAAGAKATLVSEEVVVAAAIAAAVVALSTSVASAAFLFLVRGGVVNSFGQSPLASRGLC